MRIRKQKEQACRFHSLGNKTLLAAIALSELPQMGFGCEEVSECRKEYFPDQNGIKWQRKGYFPGHGNSVEITL